MQVKRLRVVCGTDGPQTAELTLTIDGVDHSIDADRRRPGRRGLQRGQDAVPHHAAPAALPGPAP